MRLFAALAALCLAGSAGSLFEGGGYVFRIPTANGTLYQTRTVWVEDGEQVLVYPDKSDYEKVVSAEPEEFDTYGLIQVEARPRKADDVDLAAAQKKEEKKLKRKQIKYQIAPLEVLALPGVFISAAKPHGVRFLLFGKKLVFRVTAAKASPEVLTVVRTLAEKLPKTEPKTIAKGKKKDGVDVFGGKKIGSGKGGLGDGTSKGGQGKDANPLAEEMLHGGGGFSSTDEYQVEFTQTGFKVDELKLPFGSTCSP